jgi:2-oxoglutarate dehydrogenase E1 component
VIFTPKSLLRHPGCISSVDELTEGRFREVINDPAADPGSVKKIVFCSGKVYYDILQKREETRKDHVAVIRLEQLYPFPAEQLREVTGRYPDAKHFEWLQEEPANMGPLHFILQNFKSVNLDVVARPPSGSTATGSSKLHKIQQNLLTEKALGICTCEHAYGSCKLECAETELIVSNRPSPAGGKHH